MNRWNVILTGISRGGTTLSVRLLNKLPDAVALHEPMQISDFPSGGGPAAVDVIDRFFEATRESIRSSRTAVSKHVRGVAQNSYEGQEKQRDGSRMSTNVMRGEITIDKELPDDYYLCVKHPAAFTALLEHLVGRYTCIAVIRNPLAVLGSWRSVPFRFRKGRSPAAERLDPALAAEIAATDGKVERQLVLLSWFFAKYRDHLPASSIIRYEDMVASGGKVLSAVTSTAERLAEPLESRNANPLYDWKKLRKAGRKLLESDGAYWDFYAKESVEQLLEEGPSGE